MNNQIDSQQNQSISDSYIKTSSGTILAVTKILESAVAAAILFLILYASVSFATVISGFLNNYLYESVFFALPDLISNFYGIFLMYLFLILIILDGVGVLLLRFTNSSVRIVEIVHTIYWISFIVDIIELLYALYEAIKFSVNASGGMQQSTSAIFGLGLVMTYVSFLVVFLVLLFLCNYHHDICTVMKAVVKERQTGQIAEVGKNRLGWKVGLFTWGSGFIFVVSLLYAALYLFSGVNVIPESVSENMVVTSGFLLLLMNAFICLLIFLKYFSLRRCYGNFRKIHGQ